MAWQHGLKIILWYFRLCRETIHTKQYFDISHNEINTMRCNEPITTYYGIMIKQNPRHCIVCLTTDVLFLFVCCSGHAEDAVRQLCYEPPAGGQ